METKMYQKALRYAAKCRRDNETHRDLVHDAWLKWYDKNGTDLFLEPESTVMAVIKRVYWNQLNKEGYMVKGVKHSKRVVSWVYPEGYEAEGSNEMLRRGTQAPLDIANPEEILIAKELDIEIISKSPVLQIEVYKLVVQGYKGVEIAKILELTPAMVSWYFQRIKCIASFFN